MGDMYYGDYGYDGGPDFLEFFLIYFAILGVIWLISIAAYVLQSLSLYTIAKRRCIKNPWLSWIPVGKLWILGSIADQYRYVVKGQVTARRKALLVLEILVAVMWVLYGAFFVALVVKIVSSGGDMRVMGDVLGMIFGIWGSGMAAGCLKIASTVVSYVALYDLYRSCEPKNAVLYLVLGIILGITQPVFMIVCCKKDEGMPPRKQEPVASIPVQSEPWEQPEEE